MRQAESQRPQESWLHNQKDGLVATTGVRPGGTPDSCLILCANRPRLVLKRQLESGVGWGYVAGATGPGWDGAWVPKAGRKGRQAGRRDSTGAAGVAVAKKAGEGEPGPWAGEAG